MKSNSYLIGSALIAALGGLLFGFDTAVISGAEVTLQRLWGLSDFWHGFTTASGLPVIASDIEGSVGLLGEDYPGYYPVGDAEALCERLLRAETDTGYYAALEAACAARRHLFTPQREQAGWARLLEDIQAGGLSEHDC